LKVGTQFSDRNFSFQVSVSIGSSYRMRSALFWDDNPEERRSHLLRSGSLKSHIIQDVYAEVSFRLGPSHRCSCWSMFKDHSFLECGPKMVAATFLRSVGSYLPNYAAPYLRTSSSVYNHENLKPQTSQTSVRLWTSQCFKCTNQKRALKAGALVHVQGDGYNFRLLGDRLKQDSLRLNDKLH